MDPSDRRSQLRELLKHFRARLAPEDVGLPVRSRRHSAPGLRAGEVAELVGVSTAWYHALEFGAAGRRFSAPFVQRVADGLRLSDTERAALLRLALPEVAAATDIYERSTNDGVVSFLSCARDFIKRLTALSSFEDAMIAAVETSQRIIRATCMTVAALDRDGREPLALAAGPKAEFADSAFALSALHDNAATRAHATVLCENAPHPSDVREHARHAVRIETSAGREVSGVHDPDVVEYRRYNTRVLERSSSAVGLFERGLFRGNLVTSWAEPRFHPKVEIETIKTLSAVLELAAARPAETIRRSLSGLTR